MKTPLGKGRMTETELERVIASQEDAAEMARKAEIAAERQRMYAAREAVLRAGRAAEVRRAAEPTPAARAATAIRAAIGTDWPALVVWLRTARAQELRDALLKIEGDEAAMRHKANVEKIFTDRENARAAEALVREARRSAVIEAAA